MNTPITKATEAYSEMVMILLYPFRQLSDIQESGSYTKKLRTVYNKGMIGVKALNFLRNIQDAKSNCFRAAPHEDDLQRVTEPCMPADDAYD